MQLGFYSDVALDKVTLTNLVKDFSFCTELKSSCLTLAGSPNDLDTSLVKSQLIYFHKEK